MARGLGEARTAAIIEQVLEDRRPHLNVLLSLPFQECLDRLAGEGDRYESEEPLLRRVWKGYEVTGGLPGDRIVRVDGRGTPEEVAGRIREAVGGAL